MDYQGSIVQNLKRHQVHKFKNINIFFNLLEVPLNCQNDLTMIHSFLLFYLTFLYVSSENIRFICSSYNVVIIRKDRKITLV
jgi:hypothetical protein